LIPSIECIVYLLASFLPMWKLTCNDTRGLWQFQLWTTLMEIVNPDYAILCHARLGQKNRAGSTRSHVRRNRCTICGERKKKNGECQVWFLMTQNQAEDTLNIWRWNQPMAGRASVHSLCSPRHVRELAVHWMTTGCLHYPFANGPRPMPGRRVEASSATLVEAIATHLLYHLGELTVERGSLARVLQENPMSLNILLDELMAALECEAGWTAESELEDAMRLRLRTG
jgi:hypothetical protein